MHPVHSRCSWQSMNTRVHGLNLLNYELGKCSAHKRAHSQTSMNWHPSFRRNCASNTALVSGLSTVILPRENKASQRRRELSEDLQVSRPCRADIVCPNPSTSPCGIGAVSKSSCHFVACSAFIVVLFQIILSFAIATHLWLFAPPLLLFQDVFPSQPWSPFLLFQDVFPSQPWSPFLLFQDVFSSQPWSPFLLFQDVFPSQPWSPFLLFQDVFPSQPWSPFLLFQDVFPSQPWSPFLLFQDVFPSQPWSPFLLFQDVFSSQPWSPLLFATLFSAVCHRLSLYMHVLPISFCFYLVSSSDVLSHSTPLTPRLSARAYIFHPPRAPLWSNCSNQYRSFREHLVCGLSLVSVQFFW